MNHIQYTFLSTDIGAWHTSTRLFYCKFPIIYLRNIVKHEAYYKTRVPSAQDVHLQYIWSYELYDSFLHNEFFRVIYCLIIYMTEGNFHVSYLWNHDGNSINMIIWYLRCQFMKGLLRVNWCLWIELFYILNEIMCFMRGICLFRWNEWLWEFKSCWWSEEWVRIHIKWINLWIRKMMKVTLIYN